MNIMLSNCQHMWYIEIVSVSRVTGSSGNHSTARGQRHGERLPDRGTSTRGQRFPTVSQCPDRGRCHTHVFCAEFWSQQYGDHAGVGRGQGCTFDTET